MTLNLVSRLLPYFLMAFVGVAGWSMKSTPLLAMVVIGTAGVAIGTSMATRPTLMPKVPAEPTPNATAAIAERER